MQTWGVIPPRGLNRALRSPYSIHTPFIALTAADVFDVQLYTGTSGAQTITTGIAADLVWIKSRSNALSHALFDTARTATKYLSSNLTAVEETDATSLTAFGSTGFTLGVDTSTLVNLLSTTYVSWNFKKSANFFDVVLYTGDGGTQAIAHSLGSQPGFVVIKRRDATAAWPVWHRSLSAGNHLFLNTTAGPVTTGQVNYFGDNSIVVDPTSSVVTIGSNSNVNTSGGTYVMYVFAHDSSASGLIQCGGFTTDGSGNATVSGLPWAPQFVIFKEDANFWRIVDTTRGWVSGNDALLFTSSTSVEQAIDNGAPTSDGFTLTGLEVSSDGVYITIRAP